ncbi:MAG: hypothetical protein WCS03_03365 [Bacteroidota bacterium]
MILNCYSMPFSRQRRNLILTILLLFASVSIISGQKNKEEPPPLSERLFYGGNIGLQLGSTTDIQVSPVIGIWILPRLAAAVGPNYRFYKDWYGRTNIYGAKGYMEFVVIQDINSFIPIGVGTGVFLHVEDEMLSLESSVWKDTTASGRFYINTVLAGGGISQRIGRRSSLNIMVLWALNDSGYGVYSNPEIRVSFIF